MATVHSPLLQTPKPKPIFLSCKTLTLVTSLCAMIAFSAFLLVPNLTKRTHSDLSVSSICNHAYNPSRCISLVSEIVVRDRKIQSDGIDIIDLLQKFLVKYVRHVERAIHVTERLKSSFNCPKEQLSVSDCLELMDLSIDRITDSVQALKNRTVTASADAQTWLSGVLTNHVTCMDGLRLQGKSSMGALLEDLISRASTALAMLTAGSGPRDDDVVLRPLEGTLPSWITWRDRKLLESSGKNVEANVVVAADGSGDYRTVAEAIASAPDNSKTRYVIYVKRGTYKENVEVGKKKKNVMIVGDGMDLSIITGSLNVIDGSTTFKSATLAAAGDGFILQDICIQNTAGAEKHQAVALRVSADQSVINRCKIDAYQDSLYAHNYRQFYRDSYITGTVDFIFGNAAVVIQKCRLVARKPMKNQKNMVTAQGRVDPNQNTATSIQNCEIIASNDLAPIQNSIPTYLGRPWKEFSRTVVMQSFIGDHIPPSGWSEWNGDFALKTLFYGEYMNRGPGAGTNGRVKWQGYRVMTKPAEARKFTVGELILGSEWLPTTGVEFTEGL